MALRAPTIAALTTLLLASSVRAEDPARTGPPAREEHQRLEPDFVFHFEACRAAGATYEVPKGGDGFITFDLAPHQTECTRSGKRTVQCRTVFAEEGSKPIAIAMKIVVETSDILVLASDRAAADVLVAQPKIGRAIGTTRISEELYLATKTCRGAFTTGDAHIAAAPKQSSP